MNCVVINCDWLDVVFRMLIVVVLGYVFLVWLSSVIVNFIGVDGWEYEVLVRMLFFCVYCIFIFFMFIFDMMKKVFIIMIVFFVLVLCFYLISIGF